MLTLTETASKLFCRLLLKKMQKSNLGWTRYIHIVICHCHCRLAVWLSGNTLASINVVALRQTRLVLGWVTVCGRVNHLGM